MGLAYLHGQVHLHLTSPDIAKVVLFQAAKQQLETELLVPIVREIVDKDIIL